MGTAPGLRVVEIGGAGPDLVLLHGYGADRLSWVGTAPALASAARVWALDLPGHGESSRVRTEGGLDAFTGHAEAAVRRIARGPVHLVGHSLGGGVALAMAARDPERVASLTLLAPAGLGAGIDRGFLERFARLADEAAAHAQLLELVVDARLIGRGFAPALIEQLDRPGVRDELAAVACAMVDSEAVAARAAREVAGHGLARLTIWGAQDRVNPLDLDRLERFGGEVQILDDCGHLPHVEKRSVVNALLLEFLAQRPPGACAGNRPTAPGEG